MRPPGRPFPYVVSDALLFELFCSHGIIPHMTNVTLQCRRLRQCSMIVTACEAVVPCDGHPPIVPTAPRQSWL